MTPPRRRLAMTIAAFAFAGLTITGCGALGQAMDCNAAAKEVEPILTEFNSSMASAATDPKAIETAGQEAAGKIKTVAADYDGDLGSALSDLATTMENFKVDASDPTGTMDSVNKLNGFVTKIQQACG